MKTLELLLVKKLVNKENMLDKIKVESAILDWKNDGGSRRLDKVYSKIKGEIKDLELELASLMLNKS